MEIPAPVDPLPNRIARPDIDATSKPTRITAGFAAFDANTNVVTFEENVELDHVEFRLTCDILIAELNNPEKSKAKAGDDDKGGKRHPRLRRHELLPAGSGRLRLPGMWSSRSSHLRAAKSPSLARRSMMRGRRSSPSASIQFWMTERTWCAAKRPGRRSSLALTESDQVDGPATYELVTSDNQIKPGRPH